MNSEIFLPPFLQLVGETDADGQLALERIARLDAQASLAPRTSAVPGWRLWAL